MQKVLRVIHHGHDYKVMTISPVYEQQLAVNAYWDAKNRFDLCEERPATALPPISVGHPSQFPAQATPYGVG
jgi:penicillin V acylase-like amidase (Ntn superfamily)